ncbi:hypothetical protein M758_7G161800 [Ceratodon purpureus]|nr:hypothetical protein M758_7G161800 [Ceratodon purpureus]
MTSKSKKHLRGMSRSEIGIGDLKNPRDDHRPKSEGFFARAKGFMMGALELSIVLHETDGDATPARLPSLPISKREVITRNQSVVSSSHDIDRSVSGEADGSELRAPSVVLSDQDDDVGASAKVFDLAVLDVKNTVNHFAQALISDMTRFPEGLEHLKQTINGEVKMDMDRENHWKLLVQSFVAKRLFEDFVTENGYFGIECFDGMKSTPFHAFSDYCKFKDKTATISGLLTQNSADLSFLGRFCFKKFKSICGDFATNRPLPIYQEDWSTIATERHPKSDFYQSFLNAAVSVWLLHRLVHTSEHGWKMLGWKTHPQGSKFQRDLMEPILPGLVQEENENTDLAIVVGFLVLPGFQMSNSVVKCEVYPSYIPRSQLGKVNEIQIPEPVSNQEDRQDRPASSSHGDDNAVDCSSQEFSHASTSTPVWSSCSNSSGSCSTSSGSFSKFSKPTPAYKAGSDDLERRPHAIAEQFQAAYNASTIPLAGRPPEVSESLATNSSSASSSGSRQHGPAQPSPVFKPIDSKYEGVLKKYTWDQVSHMTNGSSSRPLGRGGFGTVHLGKLENGKEVAVKILDRSSQQGTPEFLNEVHLLGRVNHVNLVRLLGFCQDEEQVLIYEFAEEGSVWDHLHGDGKWLDWKQRLGIALQAACGLEYLHTLCNPRIIHRDIKSENILLTKTMVAQVADFGLSRFGSDEDNNWKTHVTTKVSGTRGYLDPEYHLTGQLRDSSDVYSFGIVLLEIITGRKPLPNSDPKSCVTNWVEKTYGNGSTKAVKAVADPLFNHNFNPKAMKLVINLARSCIKTSGEDRPVISEVVRVLRKAQTLELGEKKSWTSFL